MKRTLLYLVTIFLLIFTTACKKPNSETDLETTTDTNTSDVLIPKLSNPNEIYLKGSECDITNLELYEQMKPFEGVRFLLDIIDSHLLSSYIEQVSSEDIAKEILLLKYGTDDQEKISELDTETLDTFNQAFEDNMLLLGYNPDFQSDIEDYISLMIAKRQYVKDSVVNATEENSYFITDNILESYYNDAIFDDISAIVIRFSSITEASNILKYFNLVSYEGALREYTGDTPLSEMSSNLIDDTNTKELTYDEVFSYFVKIYNYMYSGFRPTLDESMTKEDLSQVNSEYFNHNYSDLNIIKPSLATYIFKTIDLTDDETIPYSYQTKKFSNDSDGHYLVFKTTQPEKVDYQTLTSEKINEMNDDLIEGILGSNDFINSVIIELRKENNFEIFDKYIAIDYKNKEDRSYEFSNDGDDTNIAKIEGFEVTADVLFEAMSQRVGTLHSVEATREKMLLHSSYYEDIYGNEYDYEKNSSEKMIEQKEQLNQIKDNFNTGAFSQNGYSPDVYTMDEFFYAISGSQSEDKVLERLFILNTLMPYYIYQSIEYTDFSDKIEDLYDNYFSLNVKHLLISIDLDQDGRPDNYNEYLETLSLEDQSVFNTLIAKLETKIISYLDSTKSMEDLVTQYNNALRGEIESNIGYSEWAEFKNYGLLIKYENLSPQNPLDYPTTKNFDQGFVDALQKIYAEYSQPENLSESEFLYNKLVESQFGLHLILATKGTNFTKPSAKFTQDSNTYSDGSNNDYNLPTKEQVMLYLESDFYNRVYGTLEGLDTEHGITVPNIPESVNEAIEAYIGNTINDLYSGKNMTYIISSKLLDDNVTYTINNTESLQFLERLSDLFYKQTFDK